MRIHRIITSGICAIIVAIACCGLLSCDFGGGGDDGGNIEPKFLVQVDAIRSELFGEFDFEATATVREEDEFSPISEGAEVTVNGQALSETLAEPGEDIVISVVYDGVTLQETIEMPDSVAILTPGGRPGLRRRDGRDRGDLGC